MAIQFGRYELLKKLAAGGMGQVFLARKKGVGFEKLVVLKRILPHLVEDEEFFTMFLDEARLTARLNHPNIAQIFDVEAEAGQHLVVMEYVAGEDARRIEKRARAAGVKLPHGVILRIIADAAAGLDYAHKARDDQGEPLHIVHRDISPQNLLVGFDGGVKLIDFGVAKAAGRAQHTATGVLKGKFPYMSPEQSNGEDIDARSDIFALGIVLWELLTDKRLFKGENDVISQRLVKACQVPLPSQVDARIPKKLDALVMKALQKKRDDRFADAAAMRNAIEEFVLESTTPASSAYLAQFMQKLYAEKIATLADPAALDELPADSDIEGFSPRPTLATPITSSKPMVRRSKIAPAAPAREKDKARGKERDEMPEVTQLAGTEVVSDTKLARGPGGGKSGGGARTALFLAFGLVVLGAVGAIGYFVALKQNEQLSGPVAIVKPSAPVEQSTVKPVEKPIEKPVDAVAKAPVEPAKATSVALHIASEPAGAEVELAGKWVGTTPLDMSFERANLPATLKLSHDGFESQNTTLTEQSAPGVSVTLKKKSRKH